MNIAFYVSGKAGRLSKILQANDPELIEATKIIFSDDNRNEFLRDKAGLLGIKYHLLHFEDIPKVAEKSKSLTLSDALLAAFRKHAIAYAFCFGDRILKGELLDVYKNKIINFHPSVLPMFPGLKPIDQAMEAGAYLLGNTAHFVDAGMDTGPVIMQNVVSAELFRIGGYELVLDQQLVMLQQIFHWLRDGRLELKDGKVNIKGADHRHSAFFPKAEPA